MMRRLLTTRVNAKIASGTTHHGGRGPRLTSSEHRRVSSGRTPHLGGASFSILGSSRWHAGVGDA
jgi:hypothetical protein